MNIQDIKKSARAALIGNYGTLIAAHLLISLFSFVLSSIVGGTGSGRPSLIAVAAQIIILLLSLLLQAGTIYLYLDAAKGNKPAVRDMFRFTSQQPDKIILITLSVALRVVVSMLPAAAAAILLWYYQRSAHPGRTFTVLAVVLIALLALVLAVPVLLDYAPVYCIYTEHPEQSVTDDLEQSRSIMRGYRGFYFRLVLSFLGLYLLSLLTCGIASLWVDSYLVESTVKFYLQRQKDAGTDYSMDDTGTDFTL